MLICIKNSSFIQANNYLVLFEVWQAYADITRIIKTEYQLLKKAVEIAINNRCTNYNLIESIPGLNCGANVSALANAQSNSYSLGISLFSKQL